MRSVLATTLSDRSRSSSSTTTRPTAPARSRARSRARRRAAARRSTRPTLPSGWFGKQWACATGARVARGSTALLHRRRHDARAGSPAARRQRAARRAARTCSRSPAPGDAQLLGADHPAAAVRPAVDALRRDGAREPREAPSDAIANGQFILVRRDTLRRDGRPRARARSRRRGHGDGAGVGARRAAHRAADAPSTSSRRTCTPAIASS